MSEGAFFQDLAMLMAVAGFVAAVFTRLNWPKVLGYIAVGVLLSGNVWEPLKLAESSNVQTIGSLGVVFLMFSMGLSFSASSIRRIKKVSVPTAVFDTAVMMWLGYTVGRELLGWASEPSLVLGAAICDSATTMLAKVIDEIGWRGRRFVEYTLGTSVCEDLLCVGIIALVTGVFSGAGMDLIAVGRSLGELLVFFLSTLVFGLVYVPRLLVSVAKRGDDESLLLTLLGCCFFVSYIAYRFNFSLALGAFLVGVIGSSCQVKEKINALIAPLRVMFSAVFFVSIGLLVDPAVCFRHLPEILLLTGVVLVGKFLNCTLGALATGERVKTAVQMGLSLAQIGEFAFMVVLLYISHTGETTNPMYQIVVAVSLLTMLANPFLIRHSEAWGERLEQALPDQVKSFLDAYRAMLEKFLAATAPNERRREIRGALVQLAVVAVLTFAVAVVFSLLGNRDWNAYSAFFEAHKRFVFCAIVDLFAAAMFVVVVVTARRLGDLIAGTIIGEAPPKWLTALGELLRLGVIIAAIALFGMEVMMINVNLAPSELWARLVLLGLALAALLFGWRFLLKNVRGAKARLNRALEADGHSAQVTAREQLKSFTMPAIETVALRILDASPAVGETVVSLNIRARTGVSVLAVNRGDASPLRVTPALNFQVGDELVVAGEPAQIDELRALLGPNRAGNDII